jgi:hypothetical protein
MNSEYSLSTKRFFEPIKNSKWFYLFQSIGLIINWYFFDMFWVLVVAAILGVFVMFQILLQLQYYFHDRSILLTIDVENQQIIYSRGKRLTTIRFDEIEVIQRFKGSKHARPMDDFVIPSNFYHWTRIKTRDGRRYSFSDFVKVDLNIPETNRQEKVIRFLNFIC